MSAAERLIPRKIWTRAEADLIPAGTLSLELINGELIDRIGKRPPHTYWTDELRDWLMAQFGNEYVRCEHPIDVAPEDNPTSEPEPDVAVTTLSRQQTKRTNPTPDQLRLVVEISDHTYRLDTQVKVALYARAGIQGIVRYAYNDEAIVLDGLTICLERLPNVS